MSNSRTTGKHSADCVHRVLKRGSKAGARTRGLHNRRLKAIKTFDSRGRCTGIKDGFFTFDTAKKERQYHFTKGYRERAV